jgi:dihydroflavonol-4-reductase
MIGSPNGEMSMKRINLVTGACGFVGSHLVKRLLEDGQRVIATDLAGAFAHPKGKKIFRNIGVDFSHPGCEVIPCDLTDKESLKKLFEKPVTHIFHTASLYDYSAPMELLKKVNIEGSVNLFELAAGHSGLERFLHWSTCGVFGKPFSRKDGNLCNIPFTEESSSPKSTPYGRDRPLGTYLVNDYSVTKWKQEQIAWKLHRDKGLPLTVIRPGPLYGPGSDYGCGGILIAINKGRIPFVPKDAKNYLTTSAHVDDLVGFSVDIADKDFGLGEDYNVVDDSVISYYEFVHHLGRLVGRRMRDLPFVSLQWTRPSIVWAAKFWCWLEEMFGVPRIRVFEPPSAAYMSSSYWFSNKKVKETGYVFRYPDVHEGMRDTVDWFRKVGWLDPKYVPRGAWKEYGLAWT